MHPNQRAVRPHESENFIKLPWRGDRRELQIGLWMRPLGFATAILATQRAVLLWISSKLPVHPVPWLPPALDVPPVVIVPPVDATPPVGGAPPVFAFPPVAGLPPVLLAPPMEETPPRVATVPPVPVAPPVPPMVVLQLVDQLVVDSNGWQHVEGSAGFAAPFP